jgi:type I restriction enzyme S subunit
MKFDRLGNYIQLAPRKIAHELLLDDIKGVSTTKKFTPTKANLTGLNPKDYTVVEPGQFAYVADTSRRGEKIALAYNDGNKPILISKIYTVFEVIDKNELDPAYLYMFFCRDEFDRYARFNSWGSARETFDWNDFCDTNIPILDIEKQLKYAAIYSSLSKLYEDHENSFTDLQLVTDTFTEKLVETYGTEELGSYISTTDIRNRDNALDVKDLRGISTSKVFIQSKANTTGVNFRNYKVIEPGQFAYVADTSRRGEKIALAYNDNKPYIVSSIYTTFEITNTSKLLPEFLLLWFKRSEFDRYARFNSWGSARETFDWNEMTRVNVPVPPLPVQNSIVAIYHALESRKKLAERLKITIKEIGPILIKEARDAVGVAG